jgi:radical SAM superfamily enzyme YgiQ (UPF0313 family)
MEKLQSLMKVLFLRSRFDAYSSGGYPHAGIAYITAVLKRRGITVRIVDMCLGYTIEDVEREIENFSPNVIGITIYSYKHRDAYQIVDKLKSIFHGPIVVGGPHVSAVRGEVLEKCILEHEGKITFLELFNSL